MASFQNRNGKWRVMVRRRGAPDLSRTFTLKADAEAWARDIEVRIDRGGNLNFKDLSVLTVADLLQRYAEEVSPHRKGWRFERSRLAAWQKEPWAFLKLGDNIHAALNAWRDRRLKEVSKATVVRELGLLGGVFSHAMKEWQIAMPVNPAHMVKRPAGANVERERLWSDAELQVWLDHTGWDAGVYPQTCGQFVPWILLIARRTGLRLGEICRIRVDDIDLSVPMIRFPTTKNGDAFDCPLRSDAVVLIQQLLKHRQGYDKLIPYSPDVVGEFYRRGRKEIATSHPEMGDLVIHSLRHTYTTEMAERVPDKLALLRITGRRTMQSLTRYYKPKAGDLAKLMG